MIEKWGICAQLCSNCQWKNAGSGRVKKQDFIVAEHLYRAIKEQLMD